MCILSLLFLFPPCTFVNRASMERHLATLEILSSREGFEIYQRYAEGSDRAMRKKKLCLRNRHSVRYSVCFVFYLASLEIQLGNARTERTRLNRNRGIALVHVRESRIVTCMRYSCATLRTDGVVPLLLPRSRSYFLTFVPYRHTPRVKTPLFFLFLHIWHIECLI